MTFDLFTEYVDRIPTRVRIHFTGMSENWLNPECTRMARYAHEKGHELMASTTTVGITHQYGDKKGCQARLAGFEPATHGLEVRCSIQLSYRRTSPHGRRGARPGHHRRPPTGAGDGVRTRDNQLGRLELYQLSYTRPLTPTAETGTVIGTRGFEPPTPCSQSRCATRLRHVPMAAHLRLRLREYIVPVSPPLNIPPFLHYTWTVG
jgi:hypothetical protein